MKQTLQLIATVTPENATNKNLTWSVEEGTGSATIDEDGLLTAEDVGTVTVKATATDGSGVVGETVITLTTPAEFFAFDAATGTITGYDTAGGLDVVIPSRINGVAVTIIGEESFSDNGLTSVIIPDSVIGRWGVLSKWA